MSKNIESRIKTVEEAMQALTHLALRADERMDTHESWINELHAWQVELRTGQVELRAGQVELRAAQVELAKAQARTETVVAETNERLNALINVFERHLSEGRDGKA